MGHRGSGVGGMSLELYSPVIGTEFLGLDVVIWPILLAALGLLGGGIAWIVKLWRRGKEPAIRDQVTDIPFRQVINVNLGAGPQIQLPSGGRTQTKPTRDSLHGYVVECAKLLHMAIERGDINTAKSLANAIEREVEGHDADQE